MEGLRMESNSLKIHHGPRLPKEAEMEEKVILTGTLIGAGKRLDCHVRAVQTTIDSTIPPAFSAFRIVESDAMDGLPDGDDYELHVSTGTRIQFRRRRGQFLPAL
jgi:hypothetical protein